MLNWGRMGRVLKVRRIGLPPAWSLAQIALVLSLSACVGWQEDTLAKPADPPKPIIARASEPVEVLPKPPPSAVDARGTLLAPRPHQRPYRIASYAPIGSAWPVSPFGPVPLESVEPVDVVGLSEDETVSLLGEPDGRIWRPPSRVLRYASSDCSVDVYFYLDVAKDKFQALQLKATEATVDESNLQICLGKVRDEHRTR